MSSRFHIGNIALVLAIAVSCVFILSHDDKAEKDAHEGFRDEPLGTNESENEFERAEANESADASYVEPDLGSESANSNTFAVDSQEATQATKSIDDAYAVYREYAAAAESGDPGAKYIIAKVFQECYRSLGKDLVDQSPSELLALVDNPTNEFVTHVFTWESKCRQLYDAKLDPDEFWHAYKRQATEDGFPLSVIQWSAVKLAIGGPEAKAQGINGVNQVLASGDLLAIASIAGAAPEDILPLTDSLALVLVACDLSPDCLGTGSDGWSHCEFEDNCVPGENLRGRIQRLVNQNALDDAEQRAIEMKETIERQGFSGLTLNWIDPE